MRFKHILILLFSLFLLSCGSQKLGETTEKIKNVFVKETIHDTILKTEVDSSSYKALLECQNGKVVISKPFPKQETTVWKKKGKYMEPPKVNIKDNILTVSCETRAQELFFKWKSEYIKETADTITKKPVYIERELTWWQVFQIWLGRILLFAILFLIIKYLVKIYKPI